jgi:hypothetical protein
MGLFDGLFNPQPAVNAQKQSTGLLGGLDPETMGLLSMSAAMLQAGGPSRVPVGFGQALGGGLMAGMQTYQGALDHQMKRDELQQISDYRKAQAAQLNQKSADAKDLNDFIKSRLSGTPGTMPPADMNASTQALGAGAAAGDIGPTVTNAARMDAIRPPQPQGANSPFPFSLNDIALLKTRGIDLADVYKLATDPVKLEGGSTYRDRVTGQDRYMPKLDNGFTMNNGVASVVPGYMQGSADIKGAETAATEKAKASFDLLPLGYVGQDGRPIGGTRGAYINSLSQPPAPSFSPSPSPGMPPASPADFPRVSPEVQRGRDGDAYKIIKAELDAETNPANRAALARELTRLQGGRGVAASGGAPVLQSEAEKQLQLGAITGRQNTQQDLNKNWIAASYNPVLESGRTSSTMTASLDALKTFDLKTGWGTEAKAHAANVLTTLGVAPENAKLFATNAQKFQSVAMDRLLTTLQAQKGMQTEGDSTRAQQTFAQLKNTPAANQFISDFARAKANMDVRRAQFYQDALPLAQQTGDLNEIDRRWAKIQGSIWADPVLQPYMRSK